jgi:hypothetical protein
MLLIPTQGGEMCGMGVAHPQPTETPSVGGGSGCQTLNDYVSDTPNRRGMGGSHPWWGGVYLHED